MPSLFFRLPPEDVIPISTKGFEDVISEYPYPNGIYALRRNCVSRTEVETFAHEVSSDWLESASEAEREADPEGQAAYKWALMVYAVSADGELYAHRASLYDAVLVDRHRRGRPYSTCCRGASQLLWYVAEIDGADVYLARTHFGPSTTYLPF